MADRQDAVFQTAIPGPECLIGLKSQWGLGNKLYLYGGTGKPRQDGSPRMTTDQPYIHQVQWDTDMHSPISRKLVNDSHNVFLQLQKVPSSGEPGNNVARQQYIKFGRQYQSIIKACLDDFKESMGTSGELGVYEQQLQLFELIELIWSLAQILFVETPAGGILMVKLLDWLRLHFAGAERLLPDILQEDNPDSHNDYWDAVHTFVLRGQIDQAVKLLDSHSAAGTEMFRTLINLLRKMPQFSSFGSQSVGEFDLRWRHWQDEALARFEDGYFEQDEHLLTICRILCGDDSVFVDLHDLCETWYSMLISKLLYQYPTVKAFDLHFHSQPCIDTFGGNAALEPIDSILLAALEFDVHQLIKESSEKFGNWWFVAHLADHLHHCQQLESYKLSYGSNLREYLLLDYATSLMSHPSLWQVGLSYLDFCPEFGRQYQAKYIERIAINSEKMAHKLLHFCDQRELYDQSRSICKIMGMRALQNERMGSALSWCLRSKDAAFATYISEKFLSQYSDSGGFTNLDLIDNLGPAMLLSNRLTFLGKYREFHQLYEDKEFKTAASLLLSLLTAKLAPQQFWFTLLMDALPLLESDEIIFTSQQTYELMHCLEELSLSEKLRPRAIDEEDPKAKIKLEADRDKLELMRLALARNLARSIVNEGTTVL